MKIETIFEKGDLETLTSLLINAQKYSQIKKDDNDKRLNELKQNNIPNKEILIDTLNLLNEGREREMDTTQYFIDKINAYLN